MRIYPRIDTSQQALNLDFPQAKEVAFSLPKEYAQVPLDAFDTFDTLDTFLFLWYCLTKWLRIRKFN